MLENIFSNVFGRPKNKPTNSRTSQPGQSSSSNSDQMMTGPFSMPQMPQMSQLPQMPQPPNYPSLVYPSLPAQPIPNTGTLAFSSQNISPLDSVPFEARLTLNNSTNLSGLDHIFKEFKKAADVVDRAEEYLKSSQSDYDFKIEQGVMT